MQGEDRADPRLELNRFFLPPPTGFSPHRAPTPGPDRFPGVRSCLDTPEPQVMVSRAPHGRMCRSMGTGWDDVPSQGPGRSYAPRPNAAVRQRPASTGQGNACATGIGSPCAQGDEGATGPGIQEEVVVDIGRHARAMLSLSRMEALQGGPVVRRPVRGGRLDVHVVKRHRREARGPRVPPGTWVAAPCTRGTFPPPGRPYEGMMRPFVSVDRQENLMV